MLSLKPRQLTEEGIIEKLKTIIDLCDSDDYKTKKFVGLLHDYIPYHSGLKIRLELLGKQGYIDQLIKLKKENNQSLKIEKMASQFSKDYGFIYEECLKSISLMAKAMSLNPEMPKTASLKIVSTVQTAQGNFSKKHIASESASPSIGTTGTTASTTAAVGSSPKVVSANANDSLSKNYKKKFVRNKFNLWAYLLLIVAIPVGYYTLNYNYDQLRPIYELVLSSATLPIYLDPWFTGTMIATGTLILIPVIANWAFKLNVVSLYPFLALLAEVVLASISPKFPNFTIGFQLMMGIGMLLSFIVLAFYAMRLPKGAKEYLSYKALVPYYLSTTIWLLGQTIIYQRAMM